VDEIFIEGLRVDCLIGVYDHERDAPQPLQFDLRLRFDADARAASDALDDTIDYASVVDALRSVVSTRSDQLLETLAAACCRFLADRFRPSRIELQINKPQAAHALGCERVGVRLRRDYPRQQQWLLLLGSNRASDQSVQQAIAALGQIGTVQLLGTIEHLPPNQGNGPWYYNALLSVRTGLSAAALVAASQRIEQALGRDRSTPDSVAIDIDVLARYARRWVADAHAQTSGKLEQRSTIKLLADNAIRVEQMRTD